MLPLLFVPAVIVAAKIGDKIGKWVAKHDSGEKTNERERSIADQKSQGFYGGLGTHITSNYYNCTFNNYDHCTFNFNISGDSDDEIQRGAERGRQPWL